MSTHESSRSIGEIGNELFSLLNTHNGSERWVYESFGYKVSWYESSKTALVSKN